MHRSIASVVTTCLLGLDSASAGTSFRFDGTEVRIMPLGDSITYENHQGDTRPTGERIAYHYRLWELLTQAGYAFDFVGNRNAGLSFFRDSDDADNAGFPGITTDGLSKLMATGDGGSRWEDQALGPYLDSYPADIILLHIGINGMDSDNWTQVEAWTGPLTATLSGNQSPLVSADPDQPSAKEHAPVAPKR